MAGGGGEMGSRPPPLAGDDSTRSEE
jgi:hypothetical protein